MNDLQREYYASRAPAGLQRRLLDDYAIRQPQPSQWQALAVACTILFSVGVLVLQPLPARDDPMGVAERAAAQVNRLAALTTETSSLSQISLSALRLPAHSRLGRLPVMPSLARTTEITDEI